MAAIANKASLRVNSATFQGCHLIWDFSTGAPRLLLLLSFRYAAFAAIHTLAHPGIKATKRLMSARWVWVWCRDC